MLRHLPLGAKSLFASPFFKSLQIKLGTWKKSRLHDIQQTTLQKNLSTITGSDFAKIKNLDRDDRETIKSFQEKISLQTYDDLAPFIKGAMNDEKKPSFFNPRHSPCFYAMTSGTTSKPKYIPVTVNHAKKLRHLTNQFVTSLFIDQAHLIFKPLAHLRSSGHVVKTPSGTWCGDMSGFIASLQPELIQHYSLLQNTITDIPDQKKKWIFILLRLLVEKDLSVIVSASPASVVLLGELMENHGLLLVEQLRTSSDLLNLNLSMQDRDWFKRLILDRISMSRWKELRDAALMREGFFPRSIWKSLEMVACWNGPGFAPLISRIHRYFGTQIKIRDLGLFASEGFLMSPLIAGCPFYVPHIEDYFFEFIPCDTKKSTTPLLLSQLARGEMYQLVISNPSGLVRYEMGDVVRCVDFHGNLPLFEFCGRNSQICDLTGEKLSAQQCAQAWSDLCKSRIFAEWPFKNSYLSFIVRGKNAPHPHYELIVDIDPSQPTENIFTETLQRSFDQMLQNQNFIFREHRESGKLGETRMHVSHTKLATRIYEQQLQQRSQHIEQFKPTCLVGPHLGKDFAAPIRD